MNPFKSILLLLVLLLNTFMASAQPDRYDEGWFDPSQTWIKISLVGKGIYQIPIQDLVPHGFDLTVNPAFVHVYRQGREIPLEVIGRNPNAFSDGDVIRFFGQRNDGKDELWAYRLRSKDAQSSDFRSIYTDTMHYWLTWDNVPGLRYEVINPEPSSDFYAGHRDTVHLEEDNTSYYEGYDEMRELSVYSESEGRYWQQLNLQNQTEVNFDLPEQDIRGLLWRTDSLISVRARFHALSFNTESAVKTAFIEVNRELPDGSGTGYSPVTSPVTWATQRPRIVEGEVPGYVLTDTSRLQMRVTFQNTSSNRTGVNLISLDWVKYSYFTDFYLEDGVVQTGWHLKPDGQRSIRLKNVDTTQTYRVFVPGQRLIIETRIDTASQSAVLFNNRSSNQNQEFILERGLYGYPRRISSYTVNDNLLDNSNAADLLIVTRPMFRQAAEDYGRFRLQTQGLRSRVVMMDDIWNQFDYGMQRPIALRRFVTYMLENWDVPPKYLFIIGDSREPEYNQVIRDYEVPSFGIPPSDDWFAMNQTTADDWSPALAVGRLTAKTPTDVRFYQSKLRGYEQQTTLNRWQKRLVMLSGGNSDPERAQLKAFNLNYANMGENSEFAADTVIVAKTSNDPLGLQPRDDLKEILDDGALFLHFFGHSAPNSWDLLTDTPEEFNNVSRPFIVLSLGCYSGRFTSDEERIISERFIYADNAGIAYIGGAGAGQIPALNRYATFFYDQIFRQGENILGEVIRKTKSTIAQNQGQIFMDQSLIQNSILLGDPSMKMALPESPDYLFPASAVSVFPDPTTISDQQMQMNFVVDNRGKRAATDVELRIIHTLPDRSSNDYFITMSPFSNEFRGQLQFDLDENSAGLHSFELLVDEDQILEEFSDANNRFVSSHVVFSTGVDIINPVNFSAYPSLEPRMIVSSPTIGNQEDIQFQLDTSPAFNSPLAEDVIRAQQVNLTWEPDLILDNDQTYWWRSRILGVPEDPSSTSAWKTAVFHTDTTLNGIYWFQDEPLYTENQKSISLSQDENLKFQFSQIELPVATSTSNYAYGSANNGFSASTLINGIEYGRRIVSFHVLALDGSRGTIKIDRQYTLHPGQYVVGIVNQQQATNEFIRDINALRNGDYVIVRVRHVQQIFPSRELFVDSRIYSAFNSIGAFKAGTGEDGTQTSQLDTNSGYILFGKKGASSSSEVSEYIVRENIALSRDTVFSFNSPTGTMSSPIIGPSTGWNRLEYNSELSNVTSEISIEVFGYPNLDSDPEILLATNRFLAGDQSINLSGAVPTDQYPYIRLRANLGDPARSATPQMPYWRVSYEPVPELTINPFSTVVQVDSVEEGVEYVIDVGLQNIGLTEADTVYVSFYDRLGSEDFELVARELVRNLEPGEAENVRGRISTLGKRGNHQLLVELEPNVPDQYDYNNVLIEEFVVLPDQTPPIMEVIIDNVFYPSTDAPIDQVEDPNLPFVSTSPEIVIRWEDSNPFLLIEDPSTLEIEINGEQYTGVSPEVLFKPAESAGRNRATAIFTPNLDVVGDSLFNLRVFARDQTQNPSLEEGYLVQFRVSNVTDIRTWYPYPNPMTNFTYFAFELTGGNLSGLERLTMTIYTLSGRPVKTFDLLGDDSYLLENSLRVGWNKFLWDGRDQDGDLMANGVYLYHVDARVDGEILNINGGNGVEKLVIIR